MLMRLFCLLGLHDWSGSCWNAYYVESEQHCSHCGAYRHREMKKIHDEPWLPGPHPIAEDLRRTGKDMTDELAEIRRKRREQPQ